MVVSPLNFAHMGWAARAALAPANGGPNRGMENRKAAFAAFLAAGLATPAGADDGRVQWRGPAPAEAAESRTLKLLGHWTDGRFVVSEIIPESAAAAGPGSVALPIGMDLGLEAAPFGSDGRATLATDGNAMTLSCGPGTKAAGMLLGRPGHHLPLRANLRVAVEGRARGEFRLAVSDARRAAAEDPLILGALGSPPVRLPLPDSGLDRASWRSFAILCPRAGGQLAIARLILESGAAPVDGRRATWVWQAERWQGDGAALLDRLSRARFAVAFVTVPLVADGTSVARPRALGRFVRAARERGIEVWAVEGDPRAVLPAERARWVGRVRAFAAYNRTAAPAERLAGLQLDIEPYLLPQYVRDRAAMHARYVETIAALRGVGGIALEVAVPFWFAGAATRSGWLMDALDVDGVTVMNYRTDPALLQQSAEPFLAWGAMRGTPVRIAVEYGPLPDQEMLMFERAESGRLWLDATPAGPDLSLHADAAANPGGASYRLVGRWPVPAARTTFQGRAESLWRTVAELERAFAAWPSFAGMAVHEPPLER